jgi:Alcohol dehydrogenase GroES-like domain
MKTTRAAVLRAADQPYSIEEITLEKLAPTEVLVRIAGSGMCHTDMLLRDPAMAARMTPAILGHEGAGVVEEVGDGVTQVRPGDHVIISFDSCGWCRSCLSGAPAYCAEFEARNLSGRRSDGTSSATSQTGESIANRWFGQSSFAEHCVATERKSRGRRSGPSPRAPESAGLRDPDRGRRRPQRDAPGTRSVHRRLRRRGRRPRCRDGRKPGGRERHRGRRPQGLAA